MPKASRDPSVSPPILFETRETTSASTKLELANQISPSSMSAGSVTLGLCNEGRKERGKSGSESLRRETREEENEKEERTNLRARASILVHPAILPARLPLSIPPIIVDSTPTSGSPVIHHDVSLLVPARIRVSTSSTIRRRVSKFLLRKRKRTKVR